MLQPRLTRPVLAIEPSVASLAACLNALSLCSRHGHPSSQPTLNFVRNASHQAQGRANGPKDSDGRRLGAKKSASEYVIPGNIIFKQRGMSFSLPKALSNPCDPYVTNKFRSSFPGTKWFPGENTDIGKDHTIYATVAGYVRYYRDPLQHPKRRYIGVALEREGPRSQLPTPPNAPSRRRLGMYATPIKSGAQGDNTFLENHLSVSSKGADGAAAPAPAAAPIPAKTTSSMAPTSTPPLATPNRHGTYHESNYSLGRAAEAKGVKVREYDRKDRWLAWRKRAMRIKEAAVARASKANRHTKGKKANKGNVGAGRAARAAAARKR